MVGGLSMRVANDNARIASLFSGLFIDNMNVVMSNAGSAKVFMLSVFIGELKLHTSKEVIVSPDDFWIGVKPDRENPENNAMITRE